MPRHPRTSPPQKETVLPRSLEKNLLAYGVAATASLLCAVQSSEAEIVYTPSNTPITQQNGVLIQLDLNNDGTPDFAFSNYFYYAPHFLLHSLKVAPDQAGNEIFGVAIKGEKQVTAAALPDKFVVGSTAHFKYPNGLVMGKRLQEAGSSGFSSHVTSGSWTTVQTAYVGLKFVINGQIHYGWARVKLDSPGVFQSASIYGYAYETVPNAPITTGQTSGTGERSKRTRALPTAEGSSTHSPSELGLLAAGATGLQGRRGNQ